MRKIPKAVSLKSVTLGDSKEGYAYPVSAVGFLSAVPRGMEAAADIIFFIFIIGGVIGILRATGVITATITMLLDLFKKLFGRVDHRDYAGHCHWRLHPGYG